MPTLRDVQTLGNAVQGAISTVAGVLGPQGADQFPAAGSWWSQLRPASYRGVSFGVLGSEIRFGRRNAVHEYPYRDTIWVEDMGRAGRRIRMAGWLVGDDAIARRERLIAACEQPGDGQLVHPTLGALTVSLIDAEASESRDAGRVIRIDFLFIEPGKRVFPTAVVSTGSIVKTAADAFDLSAAADFLTASTAVLRNGIAQAQLLASTAQTWIRKAERVANAATNLYSMVGTLSGQFGRFFGGRRNGVSNRLDQSNTTASALIAAGSVSRSAVETSATNLSSAADAISASTAPEYATAAQGVAAAVLASSQDPATAVQGLQSLAVIDANATTEIQSASSDLFRRAAVAAMARASADYQPASYDDAASLRTAVCGALDAEITIAGDQGDDASYAALKTLRAAVAADLTARGADLASMITVTSNEPMPSLVLAQRLYRDPSRADELVIEGNPRHPAFMPIRFRALSR